MLLVTMLWSEGRTRETCGRVSSLLDAVGEKRQRAVAVFSCLPLGGHGAEDGETFVDFSARGLVLAWADAVFGFTR